MLANASPAVFEAVTRLLTSLMTQSSLDPKLRELAILRVGYLSNASYELFQHEPFARFVGLSDEQLAAIKAGHRNSPVLDEVQAAVLEFVDDMVANIRASDTTLGKVGQFLDRTQLTDLILVVGQYMAVCRFLETTGVDLDDNAVDWNGFTSGNR
jgi:4-carboxymuconolactone decarboxylase